MPGGTVGTPLGFTTPANLVTRKMLRRKLANRIKKDGVLFGTATNDTSVTPNIVQLTNLLVDANGLKSSKWKAGRLKESAIYRLDTREETLVANYDPQQGTILPDHNWLTAPTSGTTEYEIHTHGLSISDLHEALDYATLAAKTDRWMVLPGLVDEVTSGAWASSVVSSSTVLEADGYNSERAQGNGYLYETAPVEANRTYMIYSTVRVASGQASIIVWDVTNNVQLTWTGDTAVTSTGWTMLSGTVLIPANCAQVQIRLISTVEAFWRDVGFRRSGTPIQLPNYITDPQNQILGPSLRTLSVVNGISTYGTSQAIPMCRNLIEEPGIARIYIHLAFSYGPLADDNESIPKDAEEWILCGATYYALKRLISVPTVSTDPYAALAAREKSVWNNKNAAKQPLLRFGRPTYE